MFPGLAVAEELLDRDRQARIVFAGSERDIERQIIAEQRHEHRQLSAEPPATLRRNPLKFAWRNWRAVRAAREMLRRERPAVVVGLGGFASVPVVVAASRLGIPTLLLEQNTVAGRATRWLSRRADIVCLSFEQTAGRLPNGPQTCVVGNPVRRKIAELHAASNGCGDQAHPTLLILGGSQGALAVNEIVLKSLESLNSSLDGWQIVHQTGQQQAEEVRRRYAELKVEAVVSPFFTELVDWYRRATLVVSRAGATTLAELACAGCPAVLVPYPNSVGDHQLANARVYESAGAACVIEQNGDLAMTAETLTERLSSLLVDDERREIMRRAMCRLAKPQAAVDVVDRLLRLTGRFADPSACVPPPHMHNERAGRDAVTKPGSVG